MAAQVATCARDGSFDLQVVSQQSYVLKAWSGYYYGSVSVPHSDSGRPITIVLKELLYERVSFVSSDGEPVPLEGRQECGLFAQDPIYESFYNIARYDISWLPAQVDVARLGENDLMYITRGPAPEHAAARVMDFQGYGPVDVPVELLPLRQWPRGREIVLTPVSDEPRAVAHKVVFPTVALPAGWSVDSAGWFDIVASVTTKSGRTYWVSQKHPVFRVPEGSADDAFVKASAEKATRPFELRKEQGYIAVRVDWPRYAFLDLRYATSDPRMAGAASAVTVWSSDTFAIGGRLVEPGHARFAYLPEGEYFAEISWWKEGDAMPFASWRLREPMRLGMGLNEFEVREDDVVARAGR